MVLPLKVIKTKFRTSLPMFSCVRYNTTNDVLITVSHFCTPTSLCVSVLCSSFCAHFALLGLSVSQCSRRPRNLRLRIFSWSSSSMRTMPSSPSMLSRIPVASRSSPRITFTWTHGNNRLNINSFSTSQRRQLDGH